MTSDVHSPVLFCASESAAISYCFGMGQSTIHLSRAMQLLEEHNTAVACAIKAVVQWEMDGQKVGDEVKRWMRQAREGGLEARAREGDATAQWLVGWSYHWGVSVVRNDVTAVEWYRRSCDQGDACGEFFLGLMYQHGHGVTQDHGEAVAWYTKAAQRGHALAQSDLGYMYENGEGVTKDHAQAVVWYTKSAQQGYAVGQCNLGTMYEYGCGVRQDLTQAVAWYSKSAAQGHERAQAALVRLNK